MIDECACKRNTLGHATGEMMRIRVPKGLQSDQPHEVVHLISFFTQPAACSPSRALSRCLARRVVTVEQKAARRVSAAKTLPHSAHPWSQLRYQPRPDLTPTDSATTRVRNEAPNPMNKPIKIFGTAAGNATR